ncbi:MAG: hypothetical protein FWH41_08035 [Treponema sp.]|nr:hypothetical protein [Treponema sp.]
MALEKPSKTGFSSKSKVAFSKTDVLKKPQVLKIIILEDFSKFLFLKKAHLTKQIKYEIKYKSVTYITE